MATLQKLNVLSTQLRNLHFNQYLSTISIKKEPSIIVQPPKKPTTPFINFFNDNRINILKTNPGISFADTSRTAGKLWKQLPVNEKKRYIDKWTVKSVSYKKTFDSFMLNLSDQEKVILTKFQDEKKKKKNAIKHKQLLKELNKPKKGLISSFICFSSSKTRPSNITQQQFTKKLGEEWRMLSDIEKMPHINKALNNQQLYQSNLRIWEKEMMMDGRPELVRQEFREIKTKN